MHVLGLPEALAPAGRAPAEGVCWVLQGERVGRGGWLYGHPWRAAVSVCFTIKPCATLHPGNANAVSLPWTYMLAPSLQSPGGY